jgi:hypothetical protein
MNAAFSGRKRSGKTTLAFDMAMRQGGGIIIFDPKREWRGWPGEITDVEQIKAKVDEGEEIIVFHPHGDSKEEFEKLASVILDLHTLAMQRNWDKDGRHFTFLVDEAVNVSTKNWVSPKLLQIISQNRPEILSVYLTYQDPKDINNLLKSRIDTYFIFNTSLPTNLDYLQKEIGVPQYDLEEIQHLRPHEYAQFYFDGGTPKVEYEYSPETWFRPLEYFDLNKNEREGIKDMARDNKKEDRIRDLFDELQDLIYGDDDDDDGDDRSRRRERDDKRPRRERATSGGDRWRSERR